MSARHPGIETRTTKAGVKRYRASAWDRAMGQRIYKTFPTPAAAVSWRASKQVAIANGEAGIYDSPTLQQAWDAWLERATADVIRNNRGQRYKPSVLRGYEHAMRLHVLPTLGKRRLSDMRITHIQALVEKLVAGGQAARTVRNTIAPLRVVFKDAIRREQCRNNPALGLALPSGEEVRDRIATPAEAVELLTAVPNEDRIIWAIAFYAGLRAGELMALRWSNVDLKARTIRVVEGYDPKSHVFVAPKSAKGARVVPFPPQLDRYLRAVEGVGQRLVCGLNGVKPYVNTTVRKRALRAWGTALKPITLHECRHTYASLMLAAEVDIVKVSKWMGHSSIQITVDRYGHLVPGDETAAMQRFEGYLTKGTT